MLEPKDYLKAAQQAATSLGNDDAAGSYRDIEKAAVIGAGIMGTGIALAMANAGIPVTLIDKAQDGLDKAISIATKILARSVERGQLSEDEMRLRLSRISVSTQIADIASADAIVEAVWEQMDLKQSIFREIDKFAKPGALLGTNTSTLDINQIADVTARAEDVIGLHFFSPAHVMKLLEVVRGDRTSPAAIRDAVRLGMRIGKVPVVVGVCDGFVGNRIFGARENEAGWLLLEGALPQQIDRVLVEFGFPMGSFVLQDMTGGVELIWRMNQAKGKSDVLIDKLAALGRYGQKAGRGYYAYGEDGRTPIPDPEVEQIILDASRESGIARKELSDAEIIERLIYPMINEGAKILDEGIADRASDIDVIWSLGYGWPRAKAGPMRYADSVGLGEIHSVLQRLAREHGARFAPSTLLSRLVDEGGTFTPPDAAA